MRGVRVNVPFPNGNLPPHIFECSMLFRSISTLDTCQQARKWMHPFSMKPVSHLNALDYVIYCAPEVQRMCDDERASLTAQDIALGVPEPLTDDDARKWRETFDIVSSPADIPEEFDYAS